MKPQNMTENCVIDHRKFRNAIKEHNLDKISINRDRKQVNTITEDKTANA